VSTIRTTARIRTTRAFFACVVLLVGAAAARADDCTAAAPGNPCIPGGGSPDSDCALELRVAPVPPLDRRGLPRNRALCFEGDPRCDLDPDLGNASCTVAASLCINNQDPRLACVPSSVVALELRRPNPSRPRDAADAASVQALEGAGANDFGVAVLRGGTVAIAGTTNATADVCSAPVGLAVPLKVSRSGRASKAKRTFSLQVVTSSGVIDRDTLSIECRPSTCGNGRIESDHETCDDGNRIGGDGCDRGCQAEVAAPTPTPSPTPSVSPRPTASPTPAPTASPAPVPTASPTPGATPTPVLTSSPSPTPTASPSPTPRPTPTASPTPTPPAFSVQLTAYRPQTEGYGSPFARRAVPDADEATLGAGIRLNTDDDDGDGMADATQLGVTGENDLIELAVQVSPEPAPAGWEYAVIRSGTSLRVWLDSGKAFPLVTTNDDAVLLTGNGSLWVESVAAVAATIQVVARPIGGGAAVASDTVLFRPFTSIVIALGGENQVPSDPPDSNHGVFNIARDLYAMGYDVHMYDEDDVSSSGAGAAYDEVVRAISQRGIGIVSVFGYSHGGGSTYDLLERLAINAGSVGSYVLPYTAYIDGIENDSDIDIESERRLPIGTQYHVNYYQREDFFIRGNSVAGSAVDVNVSSTSWGAGVEHTGVDDLANVRSGVRDPLILRVAQ
jgi:cysteine-rich repeat protein